jgi:hypothetical protein
VKNLSANIGKVKSALDHVEEVNKAPQQIYQAMRTFRDYGLLMFVLLWTTILVTIVALLGGFEGFPILGGLGPSGTVVLFIILYPTAPAVYALLRRKLIVPRERWKRLNKMLEKESFKQPSALSN